MASLTLAIILSTATWLSLMLASLISLPLLEEAPCRLALVFSSWSLSRIYSSSKSCKYDDFLISLFSRSSSFLRPEPFSRRMISLTLRFSTFRSTELREERRDSSLFSESRLGSKCCFYSSFVLLSKFSLAITTLS